MAYSTIRPPAAGTSEYRAAALVVVGVGLASLVDLGLLIAGVVTWSFPVAMLAVGLLVSASMAIGFELARASERRAGASAGALDGLAHDLRTPLSTTRTLLQLVESGSLGSLTAEARDALGRAAIAASRVEALLQESLRAPTHAPRGQTTEVGQALDRAIEALRARIDESGAVIERGHLPAVQADPIALERVLTNLLQNALTHGQQSERPEIRVAAEIENDSWVVSVSDNGPGVPASLHDRAFEPGVRGRSNEQSPGFGLGLSTVRRLIEEQGGRVWIEPATDAGACVRMQLPAAA